MTKEQNIEQNLIEQLKGLKYTHRPDIVDRKTLNKTSKPNLKHSIVRLSDSEFLRLREEIIEPDVFKASKNLENSSSFNEKTEHHCTTLW